MQHIRQMGRNAWKNRVIMRFPKRRKVADAPPGVTLKVNSHRDLATLLTRDLAGSLVLIDRRDLDAETARRLLDARPHTVVNAAEFISGRFANLGPELLAEGGINLFEADRAGVQGLSDGSSLRLHDSTLYDGAVVALDMRALPLDQVKERMDAARTGLATQLETFAHTTSEFLRREQSLLLHGQGTPALRVDLTGRSVLVIGPAAQESDLKPLRKFIREQKPVVMAVDGGADVAVRRRLRPDVVILSGPGTVQPKTLARCGEVLLTGSGEAVRRRAEQANIPIHEAQTSMTGLDLGLLTAYRGGAKLIVPVGYPTSLEDFIDRGRSAQASNVLTRLRVGANLVEASAIPLLYTGQVRRWHVAVAVVAALAILGLTMATTPVGQDWWESLRATWGPVP